MQFTSNCISLLFSGEFVNSGYVYARRSDPILQHAGHDEKRIADDQSAAAAELGQQASSPPSDGHDVAVRAGAGVIRDGSIRNLVSTYENKVQEVCVALFIHWPSFVYSFARKLCVTYFL